MNASATAFRYRLPARAEVRSAACASPNQPVAADRMRLLAPGDVHEGRLLRLPAQV